MRLDWDRYLQHILADGERLATAAAAHPDGAAVWCPGWTGRDVLAHTGVVHRHKAAIVAGRLSESPEPEEAPGDDDALLAWYRQGLAELLAVLGAADPAEPVWTWHPTDQSVGFWIRRMAHETLIHRADAESAGGPIGAVDAALAADGVDEVLGPVMAAYTDDPRWGFAADGRIVELRMPDVGAVRHLVMGHGAYGPGWTYADAPAADPAAVIEADAAAMDLWAWGRAAADALRATGDAAVVGEIREVVAGVTR